MITLKINPSQMKWFVDSFDRINSLIKETKVNSTDVFWRELSIDDVTIDHFICTVDDIGQFIGSGWANDFIDKDVYMRKNGYVYKVDIEEKEPCNKSKRSIEYSEGFLSGVRSVMRNRR